METALVVGTGLIGTSVAPALREKGVAVHLSDVDAHAVRLARELGAGQERTGQGVDLALIAVPPHVVGERLAELQRRGAARAYTDVASVKVDPIADARRLGCDLTSYVPGHPLAGRERSGPAAARADLTAEFPAVAARKLGFHDVPLLCATEIAVPGALPRVVRLPAHVETGRPRSAIRHVYLRGAAALRPDVVP
ncbi:chorismate mutase [Nonomuraea spiralis]|uniref:chorismate mutase n=1 Tax=Nonomuraea spiralis TaxID=46182 RepID=A0ABV5IMN1_9ACTN|nr:chorismate mutase [Nonomuraea spiralis]GGT00244.1 hypothetical protein GCM10010176_050240 [Nonomuraea spiralis]